MGWRNVSNNKIQRILFSLRSALDIVEETYRRYDVRIKSKIFI